MNKGKSAGKTELVLLLILDSTNIIKLRGTEKCYTSKSESWPALSSFAQIQSLKTLTLNLMTFSEKCGDIVVK